MNSMTDEIKKHQSTLHVLSHEIRTPLNGILGLISMLEGQELPDAARSIVKNIELSAEALAQQLNNSIEVQRITANKVIFAQREYNLLQVAESSVRLYSAEAESKGVELTLQFDPRLIGKAFIGDAERMQQILSALVSNAVKFTDSGQATLVVGLRKEKIAASQVSFRVIDTGVGIPEAERPLVTRAGYQIESAIKGRPPGSGAGLYIADSLLKLMASSLEIKSNQAGTQASFLLDLPSSSNASVRYELRHQRHKIRIFSPPSAQIELIVATLRHLELEVITYTELSSEALSEEANLTLIDYRVAAKSLRLFRRLEIASPPDSLCLLSTEFEPATAMLAKGCKQWNTPYLPSDLLALSEKAKLITEVRDTANASNSALPSLPEDLSGYTLLCVDDSPTNLIVLVGALTKLGFRNVLRAKDGEIAVEVMREHPEVDLILMDFHMPRLNGAQAARQIREEGSHVPILGVTALSEADLQAEIRDDDFETVITKPVRIPTLSDALARFLKTPSQRRDL